MIRRRRYDACCLVDSRRKRRLSSAKPVMPIQIYLFDCNKILAGVLCSTALIVRHLIIWAV